MENIPITDQWKLNGECIKCRRVNYCKKDCSASKKRLNAIRQKAFDDVMSEKYPEIKNIANMTEENKQ